MASPFVVHDPEFLRAPGDTPRRDWVVNIDAQEGPVYVAGADALYFTSLPTPGWQLAIGRVALDGDRVPLAVDRVETVVQHTRVANGMTLDAGGQLLVCEQCGMDEGAAISRVDPPTGTKGVVVDNRGGLPLNSPTDVVVRSDGSIWLTDPSYGYLQGLRPEAQASDHVYRWDPRTGMLVDGHVIGAVGVSGVSSADEDQELAVLGAEAPSLHNAATYIPKQKVHEQFRTGGLLLQTPSHKLDGGCRTGPGAVELHDHETDIMHVVHGRATVVTGEDKHLLNEGGVLVIPSGVAHQFVDVTAPFFSFVTKVQS